MLDPALLPKDHVPSLYPAPPVETLHAQPLWDPVAQSYNDWHRISRYGDPSMNGENIPPNGEVPGNIR